MLFPLLNIIEALCLKHPLFIYLLLFFSSKLQVNIFLSLLFDQFCSSSCMFSFLFSVVCSFIFDTIFSLRVFAYNRIHCFSQMHFLVVLCCVLLGESSLMQYWCLVIVPLIVVTVTMFS